MALQSTNFEKEDKIGSGSYGVIFKGKNNYTGDDIAIKKIKFVNCSLGIPGEILREVIILRGLKNDNIIELEDVVLDKDNIFLIFKLMNSDLKNYIEVIHPHPLGVNLMKRIIKETLKGLDYIHQNNIIHRDMKPQNILINYNKEELEVRITDFGLSKFCTIIQKPKTKNLMTPLYRAPEIFIGEDEYDSKIDIWSLGCIFVEIASKQVPFKGESEFEILNNIFKFFSIEYDLQPTKYNDILEKNKNNIKKINWLEKLPQLDENGADLLSKMLEIDPNKRISANDALKHEYFSN